MNTKEERIYNFLRLFYLLKFCFFSWYFQNYFHKYEFTQLGHFFIISILEKFIVSNFDFIIFSLIYLLILLYVMIKPHSSKARLIEAITSVFFLALLFRAHEIGSSMYTLIYCSFPLSFLKPSRIKTPIKMALDVHLISYAAAGFWKLIIFINHLFFHDFKEYITTILSNHISMKAIQIGNLNPIVEWFVSLNVIIKSISWIIVIFFQLFFIIPVLKSNYSPIFGFMIIIFHFLTIIFMDINFLETQLLTGLLFFVGVPLMNEENTTITEK